MSPPKRHDAAGRARPAAATAHSVLPLDSTADRAATRAARALWVGMALLALTRAGLVLVPNMAAWGINLQRFLVPSVAWAPWALAALALVPAAVRPMRAAIERCGDATARGRLAPWMWAAVAIGVVLVLPDDCFFTGDFLLRRRAIEEGRLPVHIFPQALPLDVLLHYTIPRALFQRFGLVADHSARLIGAIDAGLLALASVAFTRALRFVGPAAFAATAAILFGGTLGLCTGYGKSLAELAVLAVAIAAAGARVAGEDRSHVWLGAFAAVAIALHRSGAVLLPGAIAAWVLSVRAHGFSRRAAVGIALPALAAAAAAPRVAELIRTYDIARHVIGRGEIGGPRALDLANVLVLVAPLAPLVPVLLAAFGRGLPRRAEIVPLVALTVSLLALAAAVHPLQGSVRDWDVVAPAGAALGVLAAWLAAETLRGSPRHAWLACAVALAAAVPSVQWLVHLHDARSGLRRVEAILAEPPPRSDLERARLLDWIGIRNAWLGDWSAAAQAFARSAALLPTPRVLDQWGHAEFRLRDWVAARGVYRSMIARNPDDLTAWRGFATAVTRLDDADSVRLAATQILRLDPADSVARAILEDLDRHPRGE